MAFIYPTHDIAARACLLRLKFSFAALFFAVARFSTAALAAPPREF